MVRMPWNQTQPNQTKPNQSNPYLPTMSWIVLLLFFYKDGFGINYIYIYIYIRGALNKFPDIFCTAI